MLIGGTSFFDRKEVRDILAYLKLLVMPRDDTSLLRIINTPPRGISAKTVETLMAQAVQQESCVWDIATRADLPGLPPKAAAAVRHFVDQLQTVPAAFGGPQNAPGRSRARVDRCHPLRGRTAPHL